MTVRPCLLVDVDGVLNPDFRDTWDGPSGESARADGWVIIGNFVFNGRPVWLNLNHGRKLLDTAEKTGAELVWATRWHQLANRLIAPTIGLPALPVIPFDPAADKSCSVIAWTAGRPFVWLDDEECAVTIPGGSALKINPLSGLADADLDRAVALLGAVTA